jgi:hypothetical protein
MCFLLLCFVWSAAFSYVPEPMKAASVAARLDNILKVDWKSKAIELLTTRLESGEGPVSLVTSVSSCDSS